jgi:hypothetical protein
LKILSTPAILAAARINGNIRSKSILIEGGAKVTANINVVSEEGEDLSAKEEPIEDEEKPKKGAK